MKDCRGFTYIGLLVAIVIIGITTAVIGQTWKTAAKVEKEKEILWVGNQYRQAIGRYYEGLDIPQHVADVGSTQVTKMFPSELQNLLKDPRSFALHRYLRKLYKDPITGEDWVPVFDGNMHIKGVHSKSDGKPLKIDNFDADDAAFKGKERYSEWIFEYIPGVTGVAGAQGAVVVGTGATTPQTGVTPGTTTGTTPGTTVTTPGTTPTPTPTPPSGGL